MDSGKVLLTLFLLLRLLPVWTSPSPTLGLSSRLNVNDTLVSPWGHFELGIFAFGPSQGPKYQLCIRYAAPIEQVVTWVANRDVPLSNKAYLELSAVDRNLQLFDPANGLNKPLWISSNTERVCHYTFHHLHCSWFLRYIIPFQLILDSFDMLLLKNINSNMQATFTDCDRIKSLICRPVACIQFIRLWLILSFEMSNVVLKI